MAVWMSPIVNMFLPLPTSLMLDDPNTLIKTNCQLTTAVTTCLRCLTICCFTLVWFMRNGLRRPIQTNTQQNSEPKPLRIWRNWNQSALNTTLLKLRSTEYLLPAATISLKTVVRLPTRQTNYAKKLSTQQYPAMHDARG